MLDTQGLLNKTHRLWTFDNINFCSDCYDKNKQDSTLEMFLRFKMNYLLKIENDNFTKKFEKYKGIQFIFSISFKFNKVSYENIINYILEQKLIFGVGFKIKNDDNHIFSETINNYTSSNYIIPVLAFGKMWEIIFENILNNNKLRVIIDENTWKNFKYTGLSKKCLLCFDFPFGIYPGNFIVNQNILYTRGFIWMNKKKFHVQKSTKQIVAYNDESRIISWPFLKYHIKSINTVNHLGNMVCFTSGDIFSSFIDAIIKKINRLHLQNRLIEKIKNPIEINIYDLKLLYKLCRRKKKYCVKTFKPISFKSSNISSSSSSSSSNNNSNNKLKKKITHGSNDVDNLKENEIISIINGYKNFDAKSYSLLSWFKYPKTKTNVKMTIHDMSQTIKRGEIDAAITQTSILNKDYNNICSDNNNNDSNNIIIRNNLDVYRIGRYTRNVATNDFYNMCAISCGLQKVLPKDSKTQAPKKITKSEIGFIDLINTPDTPRHCGLILESVLDVIISTHSMTCPDIERAFRDLFPGDSGNFQRVKNVNNDLMPGYIYVCANLKLYKFKPSIPNSQYLKPHHFVYLAKQYGIENYFRMTQYALKIMYPCVELIRESNVFWVCNIDSRMFYKLHVDGLLYTPREMEYFERDDSNNQQLWIGKNRQNICNIFGPSVRGTPRPNTCHLPRISHACSSSWKHAVGIPRNTLQKTGSLHQKNLLVSYYCRTYNDDSNLIVLPGFSCKVLVMSGLDNQEDGIVVRKGFIDKGNFCSDSYETASVRISYAIFSFCNIKFIPTIKKHQVLRKGLQIGYFRNKTLEELENEEEEEEEEGKEEEKVNNILKRKKQKCKGKRKKEKTGLQKGLQSYLNKK